MRFHSFVMPMTYLLSGILKPAVTLHRDAYETCPETASLSWLSRLPYCEINRSEPSKLRGFVIYQFQDMLAYCCGNSTTIEYNNVTDSSDSILTHTTDFILPASRTELQLQGFHKVGRQRFIPILSDSASVFVKKTAYFGDQHVLFDVFTDGWPFLVMMTLTAAYGAVGVWLLDSFSYQSHFPKSCVKGIWEGFWWSYVTMTTIGYGDRFPKSIPGRIFGILFIVLGTIICSLFSAAVTTVVSRDTSEPDITGTKVGVLFGSPEFYLAVKKRAKPQEYFQIYDMIDDLLHNDSLSSVLVGSHEWRAYITIHGRPELEENTQVYANFKNDVYHGVYAKNISDDLWVCMTEYALENEYKVMQEVDEIFTMLEGYFKRETKQVWDKISPVNSGMLTMCLILLLAWCLLCLLIFCLQGMYYKYKRRPLADIWSPCTWTCREEHKTETKQGRPSPGTELVPNPHRSDMYKNNYDPEFNPRVPDVSVISPNGHAIKESPISRRNSPEPP